MHGPDAARSVADCPCQSPFTLLPQGDFQSYRDYLSGLLASFSDLRRRCEALHLVMVPEPKWTIFQEFAQGSADRAHLRPILFLAYRHQTLGRLTRPVHRFVLGDSGIRGDVSPQYRKDLQEDWMRGKNEEDRHRKARSFQGRLAELQAAAWLESQGWEVAGLELLGGDFDIAVRSPRAEHVLIEVKFFGTSDEIFQASIASLAGAPAAFSLSPYDAANYVLFRACEAAKQLVKGDGIRTILLVFGGLAWTESYSFPLTNSWIDWTHPSFFEGSGDWQEFLNRKKLSAIELASRLQPLTSIDRICLVVQRDDLGLETLATYSP